MADKVVEVPGLGVVSFPSDMADTDITSAIQQALKANQHGTTAPTHHGSYSLKGGNSPKELAGMPTDSPWDFMAGQASNLLHHIGTAASPMLMGPLSAAPLSTMASIGVAAPIQSLVSGVGEALGVPGMGSLAGDVAGMGAAGGVSKLGEINPAAVKAALTTGVGAGIRKIPGLSIPLDMLDAYRAVNAPRLITANPSPRGVHLPPADWTPPGSPLPPSAVVANPVPGGVPKPPVGWIPPGSPLPSPVVVANPVPGGVPKPPVEWKPPVARKVYTGEPLPGQLPGWGYPSPEAPTAVPPVNPISRPLPSGRVVGTGEPAANPYVPPVFKSPNPTGMPPRPPAPEPLKPIANPSPGVTPIKGWTPPTPPAADAGVFKTPNPSGAPPRPPAPKVAPVEAAPKPTPTPTPAPVPEVEPVPNTSEAKWNDVSRQAHSVVQELDLPGSPAGKNGHQLLSKAAKDVFGVKSWAELEPAQMEKIGDFVRTTRRWPVKGDIK